MYSVILFVNDVTIFSKELNELDELNTPGLFAIFRN